MSEERRNGTNVPSDPLTERATLAQGIRTALQRIPGTVNDVAAAIGCSPPSLYRWKSGATAPGDKHLTRIANLSGLDQAAIRNGGVADAS